MKTKLTIKNLGLGLATLLLMLFSVNGFSQLCLPDQKLTMSISNVTNPTPTTVEFEVHVMNTGTTSIKLAGVTGNVRYPNNGWASAASMSVVTHPSAALPGFQNVTIAGSGNTPATGQLRWTNTPFLIETTSIPLVANQDYLFCKLRLTNPTPWPENTAANLYLAIAGGGISQNTVTMYCNGNPNSGAGSLANGVLILTPSGGINFTVNGVLDTCFTSGSQTSTIAPSCLGNSNGSSTITMDPVPSNAGITYTVDGGPITPGTLVAGAFTVSGLASGSHTIVVTGSGTCTTPVTVSGVLVPPGTDPGPPPTVACYETATLNSTTCTWDVTGTQPVQPTLACYETASFNTTTCVWDVTGTQPAAPTGLACYETATFNGSTCVWDVTGTQPVQPTLACYETASFNTTTCVWDVTGTQPAAPTGLACYETATFNGSTCVWDVTGTQPVQPTLACYETASFNTTTCVWDVTGTQPAAPTGLACYETATFNGSTCVWDVTGTQPVQPTLACYETASFNTTTCVWDVTGTQPAQPTLACYETASFNTTTCVWDVTGTQPAAPTGLACYQTATFNTTTCVWDVTGSQPSQPTLACYETATFNGTTCVWDVTGTQPAAPTGLACYETATFNGTTCVWDVTGSQPSQPTLACYETASFNTTTCVWDVTGTQPAAPTGLACYETATFSNTTCAWDVTGTQPAQPTLACYQTATFNTTTCVWDVTGTQPAAPTGLACYQTATFNGSTCVWDVTGTQPAAPTGLACYQTATFNGSTCVWDVTGTQPAQPTLACYETATFNGSTCVWDVTGTQPAAPTGLACYQTATFNTTACVWDVTGTQPAAPTGLACYETATFNGSTCVWDVTGTQPAQPTLACYQTATFNGTTCVWDVTGTQPTLGSVTITAVGSYLWPLPYGTGITYTTSQTGLTNLVGCNLATLNLTIISSVTTVNTFTIGTSCGATVSGLNVTINTPPVSGATSYTFRLTNLDTMATPQVVVRPVNSVALSNAYFTGITLGTNYQIEVAVNAGPFGPPCIVKTPAPTSTIGAHCGTTVTSMNQWVYCTAAASVTGYRFRVTNLTTMVSTTVDSGLNRFSFSQVPLPIRAFGTTYLVEVALRNTDGVTYLPYSIGCEISTPAFPTTTIKPIQCGLPSTSYGTQLEAVIVAGATEYRFRLSNVGQPYSSVVTKFINKVTLNEFTAGLLPGTTYTVEVALKIDGTFGPYGPMCNVTTPGATKAAPVVSNEFKAIAYPNPFASDFMLNVNTSSESTIQIRVYDMLGKQIDNRNVEVSEIENLQVGTNYPSGVYNVIVSQGENTQTLRVIKR